MIGILDSGLGGLSVLRHIQRLAPNQPIYYVGDTANVPYGDKPLSVVRDLALALTAHLVDAGADLVIMASGTSTVAGLAEARVQFPDLPILGTIDDGARTAISAADGMIGVMSTAATAQSLAFTQAIQNYEPGRRVLEIGCPRFVPLVESGQAQSPEAAEASRLYLEPLAAAKVAAIILGCTHFPFLLPVLRAAAAHFLSFSPLWIDPAEEVAAAAAALLSETSSAPQPLGHTSFAVTGNPADFAHFAALLLGEPVSNVAQVTLNASNTLKNREPLDKSGIRAV